MAVAYSPHLGDTPPAEFVGPNGLYSKWNCWLKVIRNICPTTESEPWPLWSTASDENDLMIRQSTRECAPELLHGSLSRCGPAIKQWLLVVAPARAHGQ